MTTKVKATEAAADKWTIKGISIEIKDAVTVAAKQEGITVGEYVSRAIDHLHSHDHEGKDCGKETDLKKVSHALANMEKRLALLEKKPHKIEKAKNSVKKLTAKLHWRDWLHKGNEALHQAYEYTRNKISRKGKAKAKPKVKVKETVKDSATTKAKTKTKAKAKSSPKKKK